MSTMRLTILVFCSLGVITTSHARLLESPSFHELAERADFIGIIEPVENTATDDVMLEYGYGHPQDHYSAINTRFRVHATFKGPKTDEVTLVHFSYSSKVGVVVNGAMFIRFTISTDASTDAERVMGALTPFKTRPVWLAFIKKRDDGRFVPVTSQIDSALSFKALRSSMFSAFGQ